MLRLIFVLVAGAAVAAGCSSSPTGPSVDGARVARLSRTRFLAFGDSLTAGEVTAPIGGLIGPIGDTPNAPASKLVLVPSASYPTILQGQLTSRYASQASAITMTNAGKPGEFIFDGVQRLPGVLAGSDADVVLLMEGVNDLFLIGPDLSADIMRTMVVAAKARGRVFLASMMPTIPGRRNSQVVSDLEKLNSNLRVLAAAEGAVFVDLYTPLLPEALSVIGSDGLHPTEAGYRRIADIFFSAIRADLER